MKLTLHIDDAIAPALVQALANLLARDTEPVADPCPGHPELPLMPVCSLPTPERMTVPEWAAKWVQAGGDVPPTPEQLAALTAPTRHAELASMSDTAPDMVPANTPKREDLTQRVLEWPADLPKDNLPPLHPGTAWVYRGRFDNTSMIPAPGRRVYFFAGLTWRETDAFSDDLPHIEAVPVASVVMSKILGVPIWPEIQPEPLPPGTTFEGRDRFESDPTPEPDPWEAWDAAEPAGFAAGTNGKLEVVALDETNPDPTQRVLSWPQELLSTPLPEKPEGKTKWVYRGTFEGYSLDATGRGVYYYDKVDDRWLQTSRFSTFFHHIEAI